MAAVVTRVLFVLVTTFAEALLGRPRLRGGGQDIGAKVHLKWRVLEWLFIGPCIISILE